MALLFTMGSVNTLTTVSVLSLRPAVPNFSELFCQRYDVSPERYVDAMFWRCLHRRVWPLVPLFRLSAQDYFAADYDLIRAVGQLTTADDLPADLAEFQFHPGNQGFARRQLRLRVSAGRVTRLVREMLPSKARHPAIGTAPPSAR